MAREIKPRIILKIFVPESGADELDGVGGEAGDHVDSVVGHGLDARGAGGDDGGGGAHQVAGHVAHEAGAWRDEEVITLNRVVDSVDFHVSNC